MHTGDLLTDLLIRYGVTHLFGAAGGQTVALVDGCLRRSGEITHYMMRDERNTVFAADGFSRMTGRIGVCDVTVGPGAVKLPSGLYEAYASSIPVLAIISDIPTGWTHLVDRGGTATQGLDQESLVRPFVKRVATLRSPEQLPAMLNMLVRTATSGRPGPVALIVAQDIFDTTVDPACLASYINPAYGRFPVERSGPDTGDVDRAVQMLVSAKRPVLLVGGGIHIAGACEQVRVVAEYLSAPIVTTFSGRGALPDAHPLSLGLLGNIGAQSAIDAAREADLLFMIGCKSGQNSTLAWTLPTADQQVIHMDIDGAEIGKVFPTEIGLVCDARLGLEAVAEALQEWEIPEEVRHDRLAYATRLKRAWEAECAADLASDDLPIKPQRVMAELNTLTGPDDLIVCDASYASGWGLLYYHLRKSGRQVIAPRGSAGLGFGLPAAMGVSAACPGRRVINLCGDGGFSYYVGELASLPYFGMNVVNIIFNNQRLAWIDHYHRILFEGSGAPFRWGDADFGAVGRGFGCFGIRIERPEDLRKGLSQALEAAAPAVVDIVVSGDETPLFGYRNALAKGQKAGYEGSLKKD
ncbi:MAG: thiamine pyrophosphate-binding protein [candidate division Zixibacteria bacterium]|nr:thiamine pyrophosphate-binding protein [candidate division Zixibacteria bacterium]